MKNHLVWAVASFLLAACVVPAYTPPSSPSETQADDTADTMSGLPDLGAAPELENEVWLNIDSPLRLADLRGKVVLLDMWTFG